MSPSRPFFRTPTELDRNQLLAEALPLAKLVGTVGVVALVPFLFQILLVEMLGLFPVLAVLFTLATQFLLAVGTGLVLMYVIVRANHLSP